MKVLEGLARACAVLAGVLLTAITLVTCVSLIGRNTVGWTIVGDFELTGAAAGAAIALFLPWCQLRRGNIIVDFFTTRASDQANDALDRLGAAIYAAALGLLTWRTAVGGVKAWGSQSASMILGLPEWLVYLFLVPPLALCATIGLAQALLPASGLGVRR